MDAQNIARLLELTFELDNDKRKQAEKALSNARTQHGFSLTLLQILQASGVNIAIRKSAAVYLKNQCSNKHIGDGKKAIWTYLSEAEKNNVKASIVKACVTSDRHVMLVMQDAVANVAFHEYPNNWPQLSSDLIQCIKSRQPEMMEAALQTLAEVACKFQFHFGKNRGQISALVTSFIPVLAVLLKHLVAQNSLSAARMMINIVRFYCFVTMSDNMVAMEVSPQFLLGWFSLLKQLVDKKLPEAGAGGEPAGQPTDPDERPKWPWWELKKWCLQACKASFASCMKAKGSLEEGDTSPKAQLVNTFVDKIAPQLLQSVLGVLALRSHRSYCPDDVLFQAMNFLVPSLEAGNVYLILKPHVAGLIFRVLFAFLCFSDKVWASWRESPEDFVSREFQVLDDFVDLRASASYFIADAAKLRPRLYPGILKGILECWQKLVALPVSPAKYYQQYALMSIFNALHAKNLETEDETCKQMVEQFLTKCVHPHLKNEQAPFMRRYACMVTGWHANFEFSHAHFTQVGVQGVLRNLRSTSALELPVRVEATCALQRFLSQDITKEVVRPMLKEVLQAIFVMMDVIQIDEIVATLECIIDNFGEDLSGVCLELTKKLLQVFSGYLRLAEQDENDVAAMAAYACIECLSTLFQKMEKFPQVYAPLEQIVLPMLDKILSPNGDMIEYLDHGLRIIAWIALCGPSVSPQLWGLYMKIYDAYRFWAHDYLEMMVTVFEAFVTKGTDTFASQPQYPEVLLRIVDSNFNTKEKILSRLNEVLASSKLLVSINLACKDAKYHAAINPVMQKGLTMTLQTMHRIASEGGQSQAAGDDLSLQWQEIIKGYLSLVPLSAFYFNAPVALSVIAQAGGQQGFQFVFGRLFEILSDVKKNIKSIFAKKLFVLGLSSVLAVSGRPEFAGHVGPFVPNIFMSTAQLLHSIHQQQQGEDSEEASEEDDEDGEEAANAYLLNDFEDADGSDDDIIYDMFDEEDEDPDDYETPIDNVDEKQYFMQALKAANTPQIRQLTRCVGFTCAIISLCLCNSFCFSSLCSLVVCSQLTPAQMTFLQSPAPAAE